VSSQQKKEEKELEMQEVVSDYYQKKEDCLELNLKTIT
jgi:hypothetical protein